MVDASGFSRPQRNKRTRRTSAAGVALAVLPVTALAMLAGGIFGLQVQSVLEQSKLSEDEEPSTPSTILAPMHSGAAGLRALPPVVTRLAGPPRAWVRIEASIVLAGEPDAEDELLAAKMAEDMVAFLQTVPVSEIEGASGFLHLRENLADRVRVRSNGRARDLVIHTFIIE